VIRNINENREDQISRSLFAKNLKVPQRYQVFKTDHYNCYPMEKLDYTLTTLLESNPSKGVGVSTICAILESVVPILEVLHKECRLLYVDFSVSNIAFRNKGEQTSPEAYMIDFGALHPPVPLSPLAKTLRYCSANAIAEKPVSTLDDLQSLGFVLLDAYFGIEKSPLDKVSPLEAAKLQLVRDALDSKYGLFFQEYFTLLASENPYQALLTIVGKSASF